MDFAAIKQNVRIVDVLNQRGISLRFNGEWGSARCPLPSHKPGDTDKTFQVNVAGNWYKCWSKSCNEKAGKRGGDVINLVAQLDGLSEYAAAQKLAEIFHIGENKPGKQIAHRANKKEVEKDTHIQKDCQYHNSPSDSVKTSGYLHDTGIWLDEILTKVIPDEVVRKTVKKMVMNRIHDSYQNGRKSALSVS